jgi:hypothetical protein
MDVLIPISLFLAIFGIVYVFLSTRNKERLALIEKGADAGIFMRGKSGYGAGKIIILNLSLLLIGIGLGVFIGLVLSAYTTLEEHAVYSAAIFTMAGLGLFTGYYMTKKLDKE